MNKLTFCNPIFFLLLTLLFIDCKTSKINKVTSDKITDIPISTKSAEVRSLVQNGMKIWDLGNDQEAHILFSKASRLDPKLAIAHVFAGVTSNSSEVRAEGFEKAKAYKKNASNFEKLIISYLNTYTSNDIESRLKLSKKMAENYPDAPRCQINLGNTYLEQNDIDLSRASFYKAIEIDPRWVTAYSSLANSYLFNEPRDFDKAVTNAIKVVELAPNNSRSYVLLGDCYRSQYKLELAKSSYTKAIKLRPNDYETYYKKGHANTFLGKMEDARDDFRTGRKYDENKNISFEAYTYLYSGQPKKALNFMKSKVKDMEALGLTSEKENDTKKDIYELCAWIAFHLGDTYEVKLQIDQYEPLSANQAKVAGSNEAMILHRSNMSFWNALIAVSHDNTDEAIAHLTQLKTILEPIKNSRKLEKFHLVNGLVYFKKKDYDSAISEFEKANTDWVYNQYWMAKAYELSGNKKKSNELYNKIQSNYFNNLYNGLVRKEVLLKNIQY